MLADQLQRRGHDVDLLKAPHIPIKNLKNPSFAILATLRALLINKRYDVVHAFNVPSALPMRYARASKKVLSVHGVYGEQIGMIHSRSAARLADTAETKAFRWADVLTTDSKRTAAVYGAMGYDFAHMPSAIDPAKFKWLAGTQKRTGQVAYVGRDSYEKGIDILQGIEQDIHGTVRYCTNLKWRDAMSVLAESSVMVLPSRMESLPTVIKEAFYLRVPVVATSVGGVPELVEDGKTGFLVEPDDTGRMADIINGILDGSISTSEIVETAYKYVTKHLAWNTIIQQYERMYTKLIVEKRHGIN